MRPVRLGSALRLVRSERRHGPERDLFLGGACLGDGRLHFARDLECALAAVPVSTADDEEAAPGDEAWRSDRGCDGNDAEHLVHTGRQMLPRVEVVRRDRESEATNDTPCLPKELLHVGLSWRR